MGRQGERQPCHKCDVGAGMDARVQLNAARPTGLPGQHQPSRAALYHMAPPHLAAGGGGLPQGFCGAGGGAVCRPRRRRRHRRLAVWHFLLRARLLLQLLLEIRHAASLAGWVRLRCHPAGWSMRGAAGGACSRKRASAVAAAAAPAACCWAAAAAPLPRSLASGEGCGPAGRCSCGRGAAKREGERWGRAGNNRRCAAPAGFWQSLLCSSRAWGAPRRREPGQTF